MMMNRNWSTSLKTFVVKGVHYDDTPPPELGVVELPETHWIYDPVPQGKHVEFSDEGMPILIDNPTPVPPTLDEVKFNCDADIDRKASDTRALFVTPGVGQDAVYVEKVIQAQAFKAAGYPENDINAQNEMGGFIYGYVRSEWNCRKNTDLPDTTVQDACDIILMLANLWHMIAANIEEIKVGGKRMVDAATTIDDAKAQHAIAIATLDAIGTNF